MSPATRKGICQVELGCRPRNFYTVCIHYASLDVTGVDS